MIIRRRASEGVQCVCAPFCQHPSCWKVGESRKVSSKPEEAISTLNELQMESLTRPITGMSFSGNTTQRQTARSSRSSRSSTTFVSSGSEQVESDRVVLPLLPTVTVSTLDFGFLESISKYNDQQSESQRRKVPYSSVMIEKLQQREHENRDSGNSTMRTGGSTSSKVSILGFQAPRAQGEPDASGTGKQYVWVPRKNQGQRTGVAEDSEKNDKTEKMARSPAIRNLNDELVSLLPSPAVLVPENSMANATENSSNTQSKFPSRMTGYMRRSQMDHHGQSRPQASIDFPEGKPLSMKEVYALWDPANLDHVADGEQQQQQQRVAVRSVMLAFQPDGKAAGVKPLPTAPSASPLSDKEKTGPPASPTKTATARRRTAPERAAQRRMHYVALELPGARAPSFAVALSAHALVNMPRGTQQHAALKPCASPKRTASVVSGERMSERDSLSTVVTCDSERSTLDGFWREEEAFERRRRLYFDARSVPARPEQRQPAPPPTSPSPAASHSDGHSDELYDDPSLDLLTQLQEGTVDQTFVTNWASSLLDRIAEENNTRRSVDSADSQLQ